MTAAAVLLGGAVLITLPIKVPINVYDEGLALVGGMRVLHGDVPMRDFWAIYPPGQAYMLAALFGVFGENVMVERVYDTLVRILLALTIYLVARGVAVVALGARPLPGGSGPSAAATFYGYAVYPALLFSFGALLLSFRYLDAGKRGWLAACRRLLGVTAFFRIDLGFYAAAAIGSCCCCHGCFRRKVKCVGGSDCGDCLATCWRRSDPPLCSWLSSTASSAAWRATT